MFSYLSFVPSGGGGDNDDDDVMMMMIMRIMTMMHTLVNVPGF